MRKFEFFNTIDVERSLRFGTANIGSGQAFPDNTYRRGLCPRRSFATVGKIFPHMDAIHAMLTRPCQVDLNPDQEATSLGNRPYPPIKLHLERLGLEVKGEVCGCDLVALSDGSPELVVIGEMKQSFTLELVLQAVDRTSACDEVWLAVGASKRGHGRENDARVKKLCQFLGFGLLTVTAEGRVDVVAEPAPWKPRRDAKRRSRIVEEHRRRKGDPIVGGSTGATNDRLSSAGARRGQRARRHAKSSAGPSDTCSGRRQDPSGQCLWLVRADRTWALRADLVRSRPGALAQIDGLSQPSIGLGHRILGRIGHFVIVGDPVDVMRPPSAA